MSPEYALKGVFSVKSDVYSFGVLILEIVSGSKISSVHLKADFSSIIAYVSRVTCLNSAITVNICILKGIRMDAGVRVDCNIPIS